MTPQERATEVVDSLVRHMASKPINYTAIRIEIENNIKIAEDDAFDRAAELISKFLGGNELSKPIVTVIRSLKHEAV